MYLKEVKKKGMNSSDCMNVLSDGPVPLMFTLFYGIIHVLSWPGSNLSVSFYKFWLLVFTQ